MGHALHCARGRWLWGTPSYPPPPPIGLGALVPAPNPHANGLCPSTARGTLPGSGPFHEFQF